MKTKKISSSTTREFSLEREAKYTVTSGIANLFLESSKKDQQGLFLPFATIKKGEKFFSFGPVEGAVVKVRLEYNTIITEEPLDEITETSLDNVIKDMQAWLEFFQAFFASAYKPYDLYLLPEDICKLELKEDQPISSSSLKWVLLNEDEKFYDPGKQIEINNIALLSRERVLHPKFSRAVELLTLQELLLQKGYPALKSFYEQAFGEISVLLDEQKDKKNQRYSSDLEYEQHAKEALERNIKNAHFFFVGQKKLAEPVIDHEHLALTHLAYLNNIKLPVQHELSLSFSSISEKIEYLASSHQLHLNKITLVNDWYKTSSLPFLCFTKDGEVKILKPNLGCGYHLFDCNTQKEQLVTKKVAETILKTVYVLSPTLEDNTRPKKSLLKLCFLGNRAYFGLLLVAYSFASILALLNPIITGYIIDRAIVEADLNMVFRLSSILFGVGLIIFLVMLVRARLLIRMETLMNYTVQSAVMAKVLKLPLSFFSNYSAGDAANRILAVDSMVKVISGTNINALLTFAFSLTSFFIMFYYSFSLALLVFLVVLLVLLIFIVLSIWQFPLLLKSMNHMGETYGFMYQALSGISRVKLFAREMFVLERWGQIYCNYRHNLFKVYQIGTWRSVFLKSTTLLSMILIFSAFSTGLVESLPVKEFIVFFSAFTQFVAGMIIFGPAAASLVTAIVFFKRLEPILESREEFSSASDTRKISVRGEIEFNKVFFSYNPTQSMTLKNINFRVKTGEHLAIVGFSGSGKSTLFKLLLGFFYPRTGNITIDGQAIQNLDINELRKQMGVVLQTSQLITGTILENIIGNSNLSEEDAWRAAEQVGLKELISKLPMGMETIVSQEMQSFSGGQKQLILLARALVTRPKILLLDEATSALDNNSQALVSDCINQLRVTRISIAHRLSTIKQAHRIIVLDNGVVTEQGAYQTLLKQDGLFRRLVETQVELG